MNLEIRQFTQKIVNIINESALPIEVKRLALHQIYVEVNDAAKETIYHELNDETHTAKVSDVKEVREDAESVQ